MARLFMGGNSREKVPKLQRAEGEIMTDRIVNGSKQMKGPKMKHSKATKLKMSIARKKYWASKSANGNFVMDHIMKIISARFKNIKEALWK